MGALLFGIGIAAVLASSELGIRRGGLSRFIEARAARRLTAQAPAVTQRHGRASVGRTS